MRIAKPSSQASARSGVLLNSFPCKKLKPAAFSSVFLKNLRIYCSTFKRETRIYRFGDVISLIWFNSEAGAVILNIAYGYRVEPFGKDHLVHIANEALDEFAKATVPGAWLVDIIPACIPS